MDDNLPPYNFFPLRKVGQKTLHITANTTASPLKGLREGSRIPTKVNSDTVTLLARADTETPKYHINTDISP